MKAVIDVESLRLAIDAGIVKYEAGLEAAQEKYKEMFEEAVQTGMKQDWFKRSHAYWTSRTNREWCYTYQMERESGVRMNFYRLKGLKEMKEKFDGVSPITQNFILSDEEIALFIEASQ